MCSSGNRQTVICHKTKVRWSLFYTTSCCVQSDMKPTGGGEKNNQTSPTSKLYKKRLPFVSQPPLVWQMEPRYMSRQSQQPWQYRIRMPPPRKEKQNWGQWGNVSETAHRGGLEGGLLMQSNHDKQDANCRHKQSNISHSWQSEMFWLIAIASWMVFGRRIVWVLRAAARDFLDWRKSGMWQQATSEPGSETIKCNEIKQVDEDDVNAALTLKILLVMFIFISSDVWSSFGIGVWAKEDEMIQGHMLFTHFSCSDMGAGNTG